MPRESSAPRVRSPMLALLVLLPVVACATPVGLAAQALWLGPPLERGQWIEAAKVDFSDDENLTTLSAAIYLGTRIPVTPDLSIVGELPFANAKIDDTIFETQAIGNPYAGVEWATTDALIWELGLRLPLGEDPGTNLAAALGVSSDAPDRLEAWVENSFALQLAPNLIYRSRDGWTARLRGGPSLLVPVGDARGDTELILAYGGQLGYGGDLVQVLGGVSGRVVTGEDSETFNHVVGSLGFDFDGLRPTAIVRIPFGDLEGIDAVYALGLFIGS